MKMSIGIAITGACMFIAGLVMFYSVELGESNEMLRLVKNTGTFMGISGMGVSLAGALLYMISKNEPTVKEHSSV